MKRHTAITFVLGLFLGCATALIGQQYPNRRTEEQSDQLMKNATRIENIQAQIIEIQKWQIDHEVFIRDYVTVASADIRELKITVAAFEKLIWGILLSVVGLVLKSLYDVVTVARKGSVDG